MRLAVPYGKHFLETEIQDELEIISSHYVKPVEDIENNLKVKIRKSTGSKPLRDLVCKEKNVCIIVPDKTRACPTKKILPIVIEEVEKCAPQEIAIVISNGLHKSLVKEEIVELLGEEIVEKYRVVNHMANDKQQLTDMGVKTSYATPVVLNKLAAQSDHIIAVGLVEPHFFAGYSGGVKAILPGIAGSEAIFNNHSYKMIGNPNASYGILDENPIYQDIVEFASFVNLSFIVNVTINEKGEITNIFAGEPVKAHKEAVDFLKSYTDVRVNELADIVIVSNGGFPLDRDLYQAVKGMTTAETVVKEGGIIIMVAECRDGFGGHEEFKALMQKANPDEVLKEIRENEPIPDQWEAQILANILKKAKVIMVTKGIEPSVLRKMMIEPANSLNQAIELTRRNCPKKPKVVAIPEGPYVIPKI
jgi:nickel-dependent lactate racemase